MNNQLLYLEDPLKLEFEAVARQNVALPDGRTGLILDRTYFYPTGGGQEHDTGAIGDAQVLEVYKEGEPPTLIHVVDRQVPLGSVRAAINAERRLRHMQHHTAQHLLTQCFVRLFDLDTLSANINGYSPSTLDLFPANLNRDDLDRVEDLANAILYENRAVKAYFIAPEDIPTLPLRKPPSVTENIRIIEIDGYDYSACGGTHVTRTGAIGVAKILRAERQPDRTRIHFIAGWQAFRYFRETQEVAASLAAQMSVGIQDLPGAVQRQAEQLKAAQKELQALRLELTAIEARQLAESSEAMGSLRVIQAAYENRPAIEIRALADELKKLPGIVALLANFDGQKIALTVLCAADTGLDARQLLRRQLSAIGGKGGGDSKMAQGGGAATRAQLEAFFEQTRELIEDMAKARGG